MVFDRVELGQEGRLALAVVGEGCTGGGEGFVDVAVSDVVELGQVLAVVGRLHHERRSQRRRAVVSQAVHLNVVGMAIRAVGVIAHHGVDLLVGEEPQQATRGLVEVGVAEGRRVGGRLRVGHPRVGVPEPFHPMRTENLVGRERLTGSPIAQRLAPQVLVGFTRVAACPVRHEHPKPRRCSGRHGRPREDALVVGMSVEEQKRPRHGDRR